MHVLIATPLYPPDLGRVAEYTKTLANTLRTHTKVSIVTYGKLPERIPEVSIHCVSKQLPRFVRLVRFTFLLWQIARNADLLLVSDGASVGIPSVIVSSLRRLPLIRNVQDDELWERTHGEEKKNTDLQWIRRLQSWVLQHADAIIVPTAFHRDFFATYTHIVAKRFHTIFSPPDPELCLPFSTNRNTHQLIITASVRRDQGLEALLDTLPLLKQEIPDLKLVIANDGPDLALFQAEIHARNLKEYVDLLGFTSQAERQYLLRSSGLFLSLHHDLSTSRELAEAFAAGIPCLVRKETYSTELARPDTTEVLESISTIELKDHIHAILSDKNKQTLLRASAQKFIAIEASWEMHSRKIQEVCQQLLSKHSV